MSIKLIGRYVDQPIIVNKFKSKIPNILFGVGTLYGLYDTYKSTKNKPKEVQKKKLIKNSIIIATTAFASLSAANGLKILGKQIIPRLIEFESKENILFRQKSAIDTYFTKIKNIPADVENILIKAKNRALKLKEIDVLFKKLPDEEPRKELFKTLLPMPENLTSKEIFSEIGRLSMLGAIPVIGGIGGGILADKATKSTTPTSTANKIKEGFYQYFANIFLCNVGACMALFGAEGLQKAKVIKPMSPLKKMLVIMTGITAMGIVGGSWVANKLSQKFIEPLFNKNKNQNKNFKSLYDERSPELTDVALHVDDIATAGVLSGFKWIEPALPLMYFVSGYRAGIGYRNGNKQFSS
jgi:hypothetical protein